MKKVTKDRSSELMIRTRAAVCLMNSTWHSKAKEYFAFLSLVHPNLSLEKRLKMSHDMAKS